MKQYNKFVVFNIMIFLIIIIVGNIIMCSLTDSNVKKEYLVEINRIINDINLVTISKNNIPEIDKYSYIEQIDYMDANENNTDITKLFEGQGVKSNQKYTIRTISVNNEIKGYLRFSYIEKESDSFNYQFIIYNSIFMFLLIIFVFVLLYIKINIIKPFNEIKELPYKLSKGHLPNNLLESKNKFFGKFLWGLDLLREALEQHKKRELELEKEKKTMILSISHDIKTPLSAIKLYSKALCENLYEEEEKQKLVAKNIGDKVTQIEGFVSEIEKMSTTDIFDIQVTKVDFYLKDLVNRIEESYWEKLKILKTDFIIKPYSNKLLNGDIERLIEVVENIIENAIKYGDGKSIEISFSEEDYSQLITITNTGSSVSSVEAIHMFESFWRGPNSQNKKGSGLGLYICKQIMHKMNGEIFVTCNQYSMSLTIVVLRG